MLETLVNHFRSYGLNDLEFIIVNSKLSHSQDRLHELKNRVSFEVFQETEEEEVWNLMEGGKDDMFVYDRCGRLTFYIPFPLSILNETPLVANAILTTYFRSPCGDNCMQNNTMNLDEFVKNLERNLESSNETEQVNETYVETEIPNFNNETQNETFTSNDLLSVINSVQEEVTASNTSLNTSYNVTDFDYPDYENNSSTNSTNNTNVDKAKTYFNSIYKLFFNYDKDAEDKHEINETLLNESNNTGLYQHSSVSNYTQEDEKHKPDHHEHKHHNPHHHHDHEHDSKGNKKSDRCLEADYQVCKSWSKKRLLHAQRCCSSRKKEVEATDPGSCYHFGKKRCKKIQSILKCCIKTVYIESSPTVPSNETATAIEGESATKSQELVQHQSNNITCCKTVNNEKSCRVVSSGNCEEGEYKESTPIKSK